MTPFLVAPAAAAISIGLGAGMVQRRMCPRLAARSLAASALAVTVGTVAGLVLPVAAWVGWCSDVGRENGNGSRWSAAAALAGIVAMTVSAGIRARRIRRARRNLIGGSPVTVLDTATPIAFAAGGPTGRILVSTGMLAVLDGPERRVLFAHEESHLRWSHHRYLWIADVTSAALPLLAPLRRELRYAVERWADEDAADELGDRTLVATAVAKAALAGSSHPAAMAGVTGSDVVKRVQALLRPAPRDQRIQRLALVPGSALLGITIVSTGIQLHHLIILVSRACTSVA